MQARLLDLFCVALLVETDFGLTYRKTLFKKMIVKEGCHLLWQRALRGFCHSIANHSLGMVRALCIRNGLDEVPSRVLFQVREAVVQRATEAQHFAAGTSRRTAMARCKAHTGAHRVCLRVNCNLLKQRNVMHIEKRAF